MASPAGVKFRSLWLTSGGSTRICISRHSLMYLTILSMLPDSEVSKADMNSTA